MHQIARVVLGLFLGLAPLCGATIAGERAESTLELDATLADGAVIEVENLLGSIEVRAVEDVRAVRVEALVIAEAETLDAARELAATVDLSELSIDDGIKVSVGFPVEDRTAFRLPKSELGGLFSKWVSPLINKSKIAVQYRGQTVEVGQAKGAAQLVVHLKVWIPFDVQSRFRQVVGSLQTAALRGEMSVEIVDGTMTCEQYYGSLQARTGSGDVLVHSFHGERLDVQTSSGDVEVQEIRAEEARLRTSSGKIRGGAITGQSLEVKTGTGGISLEEIETISFQVNTDSGGVDLGTNLKQTREAAVESSTGSVTLRVGRFAYFDLMAHTKAGAVKTKGLPIDVEQQEDGASRLRHGSGGADLIVRSGGGLTVRPL
jgi:hypothetical protein